MDENLTGTLSLIFRACCACGIWKDFPAPTDHTSVYDHMELAGWTCVYDDPTCARCSEVEALYWKRFEESGAK